MWAEHVQRGVLFLPFGAVVSGLCVCVRGWRLGTCQVSVCVSERVGW